MTEVSTTTDLEYARVGDTSLKLDLYRPERPEPVAVVLYLHGGGWQVGDKTDGAKERLAALASHGIAVASANYRFVAEAGYPAQVHDAKAAVRWLRAHGGEYGLRTDRIGAWGASAGAYLASMLGLTAGHEELEGEIGDDLGQSSAVQAVVHWFGQTDLLANSRRTWLEKEILNPPFEGPLLGLGDVGEDPARAREASPLYHVHAGAPPFLVVHGDRDRVTPAGESQALHDALVRAGAESTFVLLGGAGHEGAEFDRPDHLRLTAAFLAAHLDGDR
ncbi:alpha/beta hydrolase [Amycolatopsis sp. NPDC006131]|uniref:alpha/beta hydrolase n=1 Tax=Amycolatopsis sp. NPDC006131 TaxID=3156731 RepID=UPI0033A95D19